MTILFGIGAALFTLFILVITVCMIIDCDDIPIAIIYSFFSVFLLIKWYEVIFNG